MGESGRPWRNTTHDWDSDVDAEHLAEVRRHPARFAPGGVMHLILEVIACAADEAETATAGRCVVTLHRDGSVSVADDGRGTDTRYDEQGRALVTARPVSVPDLVRLTRAAWPHLTVEIVDERGRPG
ncbi:hypothetical protein [Dactylosporangium sp. NPDC051541]|uniref:hypothetical protein n=1 Tax=Dactylosporangium sp. NPDC051541 TaxID=3363977 RepID=UPI0037969759